MFILICRQLIQHLVEEWRHDHKTLIIDETQYDFNVYNVPYYKYSGQEIGPMNSIPNEKSFPEPIYIPKPNYNVASHDSKTYIPPPPPQQLPVNFTVFSGYNNRRPPYLPQEQFPKNQIDFNTINKHTNQPYQYYQNYYTSIGEPQITPQQEWWKR